MAPNTSSNGEPTVNGERTELSKPLRRVPSIPDSTLHKELRAALKKRGMADRVAGAISTIWTNPAAVLPQVDNPQRRRIPGAYLLVISGSVYTSRLVPDPLNPRNLDHVQFALAQAKGAPPATLVPAVQEGEGELAIRVESRDALVEQVDWAIETTRNRNRPQPDIAEQGIMDPPIGVATTVVYDDTAETPTTHIFVREGSSRTSHGLYNVGATADEVLFSLPRNSSSMQAHIDKINSYVSKPAEDITATEKGAIRCAVTDFELIIGVVPDVAGAVDLSQSIKARVAQDHLNTKEPWTDAAKYTALAEECLLSARAADVIPSDAEADWLGGRLTPKDAEARKIVAFGDDRAARAVHLFTTDDKQIHNAVRQPIALVLTNEPTGRKRTRVTTKTKLPLAVELIVREQRGASSDGELDRFRKVLTEALPADLQKTQWRPTKRSPEKLYQAALKEIEEVKDERPAGIELWVRAAYVLAKHNAISGPRHDAGAGGDRRRAGAVMEALADTEPGLRHLRQVIEDDRAGLPPRQVDDQGQPRKDGEGNDLPIDNDFLRTKLAPKGGQTPPPLSPDKAVHEHYKRGVLATKDALRSLEAEMRNLAGLVDDDGVPLIEREGKSHARLLMDKLQNLAAEAQDWWEKAVEAQSGSPSSAVPEKEGDEDDEDNEDVAA
ncbi:hypothetical protein ABZ516_13605 [Streptomyces sp. NPDC019826]|uniref:hypothetical protein n=1 Tax=Streptomyces sp. NPDC019826 TaxID=3156667 RepID=UPI00340170A0